MMILFINIIPVDLKINSIKKHITSLQSDVNQSIFQLYKIKPAIIINIKALQLLSQQQQSINVASCTTQIMPHAHIEKALFFLVDFIKKTTYNHKKKLVTLVVIALLSYIAKKKLRIAHIITLAQKITKIISYLPLPQFPTYRKLNRYESPRLNTLSKQIITVMNVDQIKTQIKQKTATWDQLKLTIFSGTILSILLYNIQSFYFVVQNKYQQDFLQLQAIEVFDQLMGEIRKKFLAQISITKDILSHLLESAIDKIALKKEYSLDDYFDFIDLMLQRVFEKKFIIVKQANQHVNNSIYKNQEPYNIAKNYFLTPLQYIPKKKTTFSQFKSKISNFFSRFTFNLSQPPQCQTSGQRFEWTKIAFQIPLKKSLTDSLKWPNRQSQLLSKLVITQMDQLLTSINFSTLVYENAKYNTTVLKNRLFLYFSKNSLQNLRTAQALAVFFKLTKEELLATGTHYSLKQDEQNKREKFYQAQILKAIRQKKLMEESHTLQNSGRNELLIRPQKQQQAKQLIEHTNPQLILLEMHLEQIYMSRQLMHLVREFEIKYFNERSGVVLNPMQRHQPSNEQDEMKKLLNMLGDSEELNKNE